MIVALFVLIVWPTHAGIVTRINTDADAVPRQINTAIDRADRQAKCAGLSDLRAHLACWRQIQQSLNTERLIRLRTGSTSPTVAGVWRVEDEVYRSVAVEIRPHVVVEFHRVAVLDGVTQQRPRYAVHHSQHGLVLSGGGWLNRKGQFGDIRLLNSRYQADVVQALMALVDIRKR